MVTVRQILKNKGSQVWSSEPQATVYAALQMMAEKDIGALLVLADGKLVGIFSERDYARKVILKGKASKDVLVKDIMSTHLVTITPNETNEQGLALMTEKHVRHLPVIQSRGDCPPHAESFQEQIAACMLMRHGGNREGPEI